MNGCVTDVSDDDDKDNVSLKKKAHCKGHLFKETPLLPTKLAKKKNFFSHNINTFLLAKLQANKKSIRS